MAGQFCMHEDWRDTVKCSRKTPSHNRKKDEEEATLSIYYKQFKEEAIRLACEVGNRKANMRKELCIQAFESAFRGVKCKRNDVHIVLIAY